MWYYRISYIIYSGIYTHSLINISGILLVRRVNHSIDFHNEHTLFYINRTEYLEYLKY